MRGMTSGLQGNNAAFQGALGKQRSPLRVYCQTDEETGKITRKTESTADRELVYDYEYDADGHLFRVFRNDFMTEQYLYTGIGQREVKSSGWANESTKYFYGADGCLYMAASVPLMLRFEYDDTGNVTVREEGQRVARYVYQNTMLRQAVLPDGTTINYTFDPKGKNPLGPVAKYYGPVKKGNLAMEYAWKDLTTLAACFDHRTKLRYDFTYSGNALARVRLRGHAVGRLFRTRSNDIELLVGCDQVNTPKVLTDTSGREVKWLEYDGFGILAEDSYPELFIPIGFAGGLLDKDTGFVRFGYRDYDPSVGRFTCPDPLGDTGGDHDLYDYCVDDPVNMNDPMGLLPPAILAAIGMAGATGIAATGTLTAAGIAEGANLAIGDEKNSGKAWQGAKDIITGPLPAAGAIGAAGAAASAAAPSAIGAAGSAYTNAGQAAGAAIQASKHGEKIIQGATGAARFIEPIIVPGPAAAATKAGIVGNIVNKIAEEVSKHLNKEK